MMGGYSEDEDEFFDALEVFDYMPDLGLEGCSTSGFGYDYWVGNLNSVDARRDKLLRFMGLNSSWHVKRDREDGYEDDFVDEIKDNTELMLDENINPQDKFLCRQPSLTDWSSKTMEVVPSGSVNKYLELKTVNWDESGDDLLMKRSFDFSVESNPNFGLSSRQSVRKEGDAMSLLDRRKKVKTGWLQKLNVMARITNEQHATNPKDSVCTCSVHVHSHKKKSKELSSLYATQEFPAHNGTISIIKFSHDGRYLASAGEDGILCIWKIFEDQDPRVYKIQETNHSTFSFSANHLSELAPLKAEKTLKIRGFGKSFELACVILPPKVFRILEKPVHEFVGHGGEILSLSWSKNGYLLSSSVDNTVRMWKLGQHECLKIFTHNNYVTCVDFNSVDDNYFISGSIDGKVRIWDVHSCQVIDWIDLGDIVTAVCYNPDGQGSIVGTLDGKCSFYDIIVLPS